MFPAAVIYFADPGGSNSLKRVAVMSANLQPRLIVDGVVSVAATTDVDPLARGVENILVALADALGGFIHDCVNSRLRSPNSPTWIALKS
jgi:hypothetical protein